MQVKIITPDSTAFEGEAQAITFPGNGGEFEVLNQHAAMISLLKQGTMRLKTNSSEQTFNVDGGVVEVLNNNVVVLVESIENAKQESVEA